MDSIEGSSTSAYEIDKSSSIGEETSIINDKDISETVKDRNKSDEIYILNQIL